MSGIMPLLANELDAGEALLDTNRALDQFLSTVERKAFRIARIAVGNPDDALDIVQDAMMGLAQKYAARPSEEWKPLFYRILQSRILDFHRKQNTRNRWTALLDRFRSHDDEDGEDAINTLPDPVDENPMLKASGQDAIQELEQALQTLPARQQQAFLLRAWEGLSVEETANAMGCSAGSVKTHYSRATQTLKSLLEDHWP
jgi:RNA polymerase sigma-70 factor (ECF subfamily)